jgi:nitrogen regulatory protein P-II 1
MSEAGMRQIEAIIKSEKFPSVDKALRHLGVSGVTMMEAKGRGRDKVITTSYVRGKWTFTTDVIHRVIVNVVVDASDVDKVVDAIDHSLNPARGTQKKS